MKKSSIVILVDRYMYFLQNCQKLEKKEKKEENINGNGNLRETFIK